MAVQRLLLNASLRLRLTCDVRIVLDADDFVNTCGSSACQRHITPEAMTHIANSAPDAK